MTALFDRSWYVRVEDVATSELDISFRIRKTLRVEPNKCTVSIMNFSAEHRAGFEKLKALSTPKSEAQKQKDAQDAAVARKNIVDYIAQVQVNAGYADETPLLFRGDITSISTRFDGATYITEIESEDGGRSLLTARVTASLPPGETLLAAVRACADAMGVGLGNALEYRAELNTTFRTGSVLDGSATKTLTGILRRAGLRFSIQNGVLQLARKNKGVFETAEVVVLNSESGLVLSPERDSTGEVKATCLLIPGIVPGAYVQLQSKAASGLYYVSVVEHIGDTSGSSWYHEMSLLPG